MNSQYFTLHKGDSVDINLNWSDYATKDDLKNVTGTDISSFALKTFALRFLLLQIAAFL